MQVTIWFESWFLTWQIEDLNKRWESEKEFFDTSFWWFDALHFLLRLFSLFCFFNLFLFIRSFHYRKNASLLRQKKWKCFQLNFCEKWLWGHISWDRNSTFSGYQIINHEIEIQLFHAIKFFNNILNFDQEVDSLIMRSKFSNNAFWVSISRLIC